MIDRERALIATLVYTFKNKEFFNSHRVGVKRMPDEAKMYEFNGEILPNSINLRDDKYYQANHDEFLTNPTGVKIEFTWRKGSNKIKLLLPEGYDFRGEEEDGSRFEGRYYPHSDIVEIRDYSQDKDKYVYRIKW